ncbi:hypothetical protein D3C86_1295990 [compost metagenome]
MKEREAAQHEEGGLLVVQRHRTQQEGENREAWAASLLELEVTGEEGREQEDGVLLRHDEAIIGRHNPGREDQEGEEGKTPPGRDLAEDPP